MKISELRYQNTILIYRTILSGIDNAKGIAEATGLSMMTVSKITHSLVDREILELHKPKRNVTGRRIHRFKPSHKYFCYFIDMQKDYFSTIGISTNGTAVERFDYPINYEDRGSQAVFDDLVLKRIKSKDSYKYCTCIFLLGNEASKLKCDDTIIRITKEELIAESLSDVDKTIFFDFNGKYAISLYSHIIFPNLNKKEIFKITDFDDEYNFTGELYFESFNALEIKSTKKLEEFI